MKWHSPLTWAFGIRKDAVVVHSYSEFIFVWPLIVLGFLFYPQFMQHVLTPDKMGWIYIVTLILVLLTMGIDINRNVTIFWVMTVFCVWFGLWLLHDRGILFFSKLGDAIAELKPAWTPSFGLALSILLSFFYIIIVASAWLNDRWRFVPGEIEHWAFGRNDDSMGRGAKVISTSYPDVLELLLMLAGTITIYNAQKTMVLARINRVPLLPFRVKLINRLLESVSVTAAQATEEETAASAEAEHNENAAENESGSLQP